MRNVLICRGIFDSMNREQFEKLGIDVSNDHEIIPMRIVLDHIITWIESDDFDGEKTTIIHLTNGRSFWIIASIDVIDKMMMGS
jgi:hypothetical protein